MSAFAAATIASKGWPFRRIFARLAAIKQVADSPMHEQIGIASDRRCEMGVRTERKAKVPLVRRLIHRLLHAAQDGSGQHGKIRSVANQLENPIDFAGPRSRGVRNRYAKPLEQEPQLLQPVPFRSRVDAIQSG